ncbi:putative membrane protein [Acinetobacter sp. 1000160]|nr:putative membrane protein [Acinetobacter baumannii 146457]EYT23592.1 putative membrane protein [Acinetobacter sp. 1000160]
MWSIPWFWLFSFFMVYFIPKGWQSIVIFSIANVLAYALLFWLRG